MFSTEDILKATNAVLLQGSAHTSFRSVSTDSRAIKLGSLFIPLVGRKFDGHNFITNSLMRGAAGALTANNLNYIPKNKVLIKVTDTQKALHEIALCHRKKFKLPMIGITGSSGKTTTKDMLASILSQEGKTLKNEQNYNNEIGVPLTLLNLDRTHKAAVIEMAMQRKGEIDELARIVLPKIAVITNIGEAHVQYLKSRKNIAKVKAEILNYLKRGDITVLNAEDDYFKFLKRKAKKASVISYGLSRKAEVHASGIVRKNHGISFNLNFRNKKYGIELPLPGIHNVYNALAASAAALSLGIKLISIQKGLSKFKPSSKRMEIITKRGIRIINDSYNANPSSMKAALSVLSEQGPVVGATLPRRIAVLGDMLELGHLSKKAHVDIGKCAARKHTDILVTKGFLSKDIALGAKKTGMKKVYSAKSNEQAYKILKKLVRPNDVILIKGSRGMKMEEIAGRLTK